MEGYIIVTVGFKHTLMLLYIAYIRYTAEKEHIDSSFVDYDRLDSVGM